MEQQPNLLNEKLYIIRDLEGEQNSEAIEVLRELEEKLKQYRWFIGIALFGSTVRGYSSESSDIDIKLIYDGFKTSRTEAINTTKLLTEEVCKIHGFSDEHISFAYIVEFNIDKIRSGLLSGGSSDSLDALLTLKELSGITIGEKVDEYRDQVKEILNKVSLQEREKISNKIVDYCVSEEKLSEGKIANRLQMNEDELKKLWLARKELWTNRLNTIWA